MPNNDYVKREDIFPAVTEIAKEIVFGNQDDDKVVDIINSIPAADVEPKREWIPVTDRLPKVGEEVLVYAVGRTDDFSSTITITDRMIFRMFPSSEGVETWSSPWQYFMINYEITHWMPLPEPPKEEDDDK